MTFRKRVFDVVSQIPSGSVMTYGDVAEVLGTKAYQAIGQILHTNSDPVKIPCHRIVKKDGSLASGYAMGGQSMQRERLESEGVVFLKNKIDLGKHKYKFGKS